MQHPPQPPPIQPPALKAALGQVMTPAPLARLMARWLAQGPRPVRQILDPALGGGILAQAALQACPGARLRGHEIDQGLAQAAQAALAGQGLAGRLDLRLGDHLAAPPGLFDAIIANPPWVRARDMADPAGQIGRVAARAGLELAPATNLHLLFLIDCCLRLAPGGRLAFLLPSEWLNANYATPVKAFLLRRGLLRALVDFPPETALFPGALTTAMLLFAQAPCGGGAPSQGAGARLRLGRLTGDWLAGDDLSGLRAESLDPQAGLAPPAGCFDLPAAALAPDQPWGPVLAGAIGADQLGHCPPGYLPLGQIARPRRGLATGANGFFLRSAQDLAARGLAPGESRLCLARAQDAPGFLVDAALVARLGAAGRANWLLLLAGDPRRLSPAAQALIAEGEAAGLHLRALTRARRPWHAPEAMPIAPILATVMARGRLRFLENAAGLVNLTPFHGLFLQDPARFPLRALLGWLNGVPMAETIAARARRFGGGLRKLEPGDLARLPLPDPARIAAQDMAGLADAFTALADGRPAAQARLDALACQIAQGLAK